MGHRITDLDSAEFAELFTNFEHTAYRLETLQQYGVGYEDESFREFLAGKPLRDDPARNEWTAMIRRSIAAGKTFQRVHVVAKPLSDYLRYELEWWYGPNVEAGEDIRILPAPPPGRGPLLPGHDYWLFDSSHLWIMAYDADGRFLYAEYVDDPAQIVSHAYGRDAALHHAIPYADYMRRMKLPVAS
jgi:hypothetical protein